MKAYLVYGDVFFERPGQWNTFGIFSTQELAEKVKKQKEEIYFKLWKRNGKTNVRRSDVHFHIMEIEIDTVIDKELGGYVE